MVLGKGEKMSVLKAFYFAFAGCMFFTVVHLIFLAEPYNWRYSLEGVPVGLIVGWLDFVFLSFFGFTSFFFAGKEVKKSFAMREVCKNG